MDFVQLECDGKDYTQKLREYGTHSLLFLNIEVITLLPNNLIGGCVIKIVFFRFSELCRRNTTMEQRKGNSGAE